MIKQAIRKEVVQVAEDEVNKYLTFVTAEKTYAVNILSVREIIEYGEITPVPMMPDFICGAINLRGHAVPVIDLASRLEVGETELGNKACIIVVEMKYEDGAMDVGVVVDYVSRVVDLPDSQIEKAPSFGGNIRTDFVEGMGKINDDFVVLLRIQGVLSMDDLRILAQSSE